MLHSIFNVFKTVNSIVLSVIRMSNLNLFVTSQLNRSDLHVNARYIFDWPGVLPAIDTESPYRFGNAIVQNVDIGGTDHNELQLMIDGHSIPILGTPKLATTMSMMLMLDKHVMDGTYGKLIDMMYLSDDYGTTDGLSDSNFTNNISPIARLYLLNEHYTIGAPKFNPLNSPRIAIHHPRVKSVGGLTFDSTTSDVTKCRLELVFSWFDHEPAGQ